jgi:hypothetical protein
MEERCWLCDGTIRKGDGVAVPSLGGVKVHRGCGHADLGVADEDSDRGAMRVDQYRQHRWRTVD